MDALGKLAFQHEDLDKVGATAWNFASILCRSKLLKDIATWTISRRCLARIAATKAAGGEEYISALQIALVNKDSGEVYNIELYGRVIDHPSVKRQECARICSHLTRVGNTLSRYFHAGTGWLFHVGTPMQVPGG